jgi:hypothetical protein
MRNMIEGSFQLSSLSGLAFGNELSFPYRLHWWGYAASNRNYGASGRISGDAGTLQNFFLDIFHEILNLALHFFHTLAHL